MKRCLISGNLPVVFHFWDSYLQRVSYAQHPAAIEYETKRFAKDGVRLVELHCRAYHLSYWTHLTFSESSVWEDKLGTTFEEKDHRLLLFESAKLCCLMLLCHYLLWAERKSGAVGGMTAIWSSRGPTAFSPCNMHCTEFTLQVKALTACHGFPLENKWREHFTSIRKVCLGGTWTMSQLWGNHWSLTV